MRRSLPCWFMFLLAAVLCGCGTESTTPAPSGPGTGIAHTPAEAITGMLALAEAGQWEHYVERYYGEQKKMTEPAKQIKQVAKKLEALSAQIIGKLKGCIGIEPTLSEEGTKATYPNGLMLYKGDGIWGFHL